MARRELLTVFGADVRYDVVWTGAVESERDLRTMADAAVKKTTLAPSARPRGVSSEWGAVKPVLLSILSIVAIVARMKRRNPAPPTS